MTDIINEEISLETLPYPMFETTEEEKEELRRVSTLLKNSQYSQRYFLCWLINEDQFLNLVETISSVLSECYDPANNLGDYVDQQIGGDYFGNNAGNEIQAQLRIIWIKKLLAYKGE